MKKSIEKIIEKAKEIEPTITGWEIDHKTNFLWAEYEMLTPLGKIRGIDLDKMEIR